MVKNEEEPDAEAYAVFNRGVAESQRHNAGEFDGLIGSFQGEHSELLTYLCISLREYLLDRCADEDTRAEIRLKKSPDWNDSPEELAYFLLAEYSIPWASDWYISAPRDVELTLRLLNAIRSVLLRDPEARDEWILGKAGMRGMKSQERALKGAARGGETRSKQAWNQWGKKCVKEAGTLLLLGRCERRELSGLLARKYHKSPQTVRKLLNQHLK